MKKVFTTGQVAKACNVAPRTVSKWFDTGRLGGYRIPGSMDRRIPRDELLKFMRLHNIPVDVLESSDLAVRVLLVGAIDGEADALAVALRSRLGDSHEIVVTPAASGFEAGIRAEGLRPTVVVVDMAMGRIEACQIADGLKRTLRHDAPAVLAFGLLDARPAAIDEVVPRGEGLDSLAVRICGLKRKGA